MNKMKQLIFVVIGFIIAALVIGLLFGSVKSDIAQQVEENKRESSIAAVSESIQREQEIVLFTTYQYAGATKISSGCFINKNGKRFVFDCDKEEISDPTKLFEKFSAKLDEIDGKEELKEYDMKTICELISNIKIKNKYVSEKYVEEEPPATETIYAVIVSGEKKELLKLFSRGVKTEILSDSSVRSFRKIYLRKFPELKDYL